jgi:hypothetical protein
MNIFVVHGTDTCTVVHYTDIGPCSPLSIVTTHYSNTLLTSFAGFFLKLGVCDQPAGEDIFDDKRHWEVPDETDPVFSRIISIEENGKEQQQALLSDKEIEADVPTSNKETEMVDIHVQSTDEV